MRTFLLVAIFLVTTVAHSATMGTVKSKVFFTDRTTTGTSEVAQPLGSIRTVHAYGSVTAATGSATVLVEVSNDGIVWYTQKSLALTLSTTASSDILETNTAWKYMRANVSAITGTGAKVSVVMGAQL